MGTVLITGGTGLVGKRLGALLSSKGYTVKIVSSKRSEKSYYWDIDKQEIDSDALRNVDHIVHLAGANIGEKYWTKKRKKLIIDSRVKSAQLLFEAVKKLENKPKTVISASAIGYYGAITSDTIFTENDKAATDFLGTVCNEWELAATKFATLDLRVVTMRTAVVLSPQGGALQSILKPIRYGFGAVLGTGRQFMPWIHIDDLCEMYCRAIEDETMNGAYNAVAPEHITNKTFTKLLTQKLHKPLLLPAIPSIFLKIVLGQMSDLLLKGSRISCDKMVKTGFEYKFPNVFQAIDHCV